MEYLLRRIVPDEKIDSLHENCLIDMYESSASRFGTIIARSEVSGETIGAIGLNHTVEFMPNGIAARGHSLDENRNFIAPPIQEMWTIVPTAAE